MDVWARDFMPIQLTHDVYLSFTYKPDYLQDYPNCVTNWQLHRVHAGHDSFEFKVVQMPLILDGGNVVKAVVQGKPCLIMCKKVLDENNLSDEDFDNWWKQWWKQWRKSIIDYKQIDIMKYKKCKKFKSTNFKKY